jgi:RND family efflux transporter MFP subunit
MPYVEIVRAESGTLPLEQRLSGVVRARNQVAIFSETSGIVEEVYVDNGDQVEIGQPLLRLNARLTEEQLKQAEAQLKVQQASSEQASARLKELEMELRLTEELARRDFISDLEISRLRAQVEIARADLRRALAVVESAESSVEERRWALSRMVVRSPVNGLIGRRNVEPGTRIDTSRQLFMAGDLGSVRVVVQLTEQMMSSIEIGQRAVILSDQFPLKTFEASVSRISPFLEAGTFSTEASIDLENPDGVMRSGMYVDVNIFYGESELTTLIPNSALHEDPRTGRLGVFLATDLSNRSLSSDRKTAATDIIDEEAIFGFVFREVHVTARGRSATGVRGLEPGDWVVAVGHDLLARGRNRESQEARVRVIEWDHLTHLQQLQERDILRAYMERHQQLIDQAAVERSAE